MKIAIDGPAGSGKSTVARLVAEGLGFSYIDSGAMYRAVTCACLHEGIDLTDLTAVAEKAAILHIELQDNSNRVLVDGRDVTQDIRTPEVTEQIHHIAGNASVREVLVNKQRALGATINMVMEGRDIQTVVLPDAELKIFLTADTRERAVRRHAELLAKGEELSLDTVEEMVIERDRKDCNRSVGPLKKADDAIELDTTGMSIEEVVEEIIRHASNA
jgi:CMP/dCMP kinase